MLNDSGNSNGYIRIVKPDEPVYRIFPLWFLEEALRLKQLALVHPTLWEDPFELLLESIAIIDDSTTPHSQIFLEHHVKPAYAQAWSRTSASDTLLRAYSRVVKDSHSGRNTCPREEGVRVRSTPLKLLGLLRSWCPTDSDRNCFIGSVQYMKRDDLLQHVANLVHHRGPSFFASGEPRAQLLLMKRIEYVHEAEVRLIYTEEREVPFEKVIRVPFEPNKVIEEIALDPRLLKFEANEREVVIRNLGYEGSITVSDLYQRTMVEIAPRPKTPASDGS